MLLEFHSNISISRNESSQQMIIALVEKSKNELIEQAMRDTRNRIAGEVKQSARNRDIHLELKAVLIFGENIEKLSDLIDELLEVNKDLAAKLLNILK